MASGYEGEKAVASQAERRGDALLAAVHWALAAHLAPDPLALVDAAAALRRTAELALHQAAYAANQARYPWREIAPHANMPWQSAHRRYGRRPAKLAPYDRSRRTSDISIPVTHSPR